MYVDMPGDFLTLDGEQIYGFGLGLFFLSNGEALNLASEPPTYRNIPLKKLNPAYFWFLRGISAASLLVFLGVILLLPVVGIVALFRRRRITDQVPHTQARNGIPGWLTGTLVWLASLLGVLAILGTAVLPMILQGGALTVDKLRSQYPALIYGHIPKFNPVLPGLYRYPRSYYFDWGK